MPCMEVLVVPAAPQTALLCRVRVPADAVGYLVHPIERLSGGHQVCAGPHIHPVLMRIADMAHPAHVPRLFFLSDVLQSPVSPGDLMTGPVAEMSRRSLLLVLFNGSLHVQWLGTNDAQNWSTAQSLGVKKAAARQFTCTRRFVEACRVAQVCPTDGGGQFLLRAAAQHHRNPAHGHWPMPVPRWR